MNARPPGKPHMTSLDFTNVLMLTSNFATPVVVLAGLLVLIRYLNRDESSPLSRDLPLIREEIAHGLDELKEKLAAARSTGLEPSTEDRSRLVEETSTRLRNETSETLLTELRAEYDKKKIRDERLQGVERQHTQTIGRLREELYALRRRGNLNLSIGILTTITGLFLLAAFVMGNSFIPSREAPPTLEKFLIDFVPRLSLVVLIEIFAYFFLSLYKSSLAEIKYFQNEVTSIEAKFMALRLAAQSDSLEHLTSAIDSLAKTERNFILKKNQTTVDLERARIEQAEKADWTAKLSELLRGKKEA